MTLGYCCEIVGLGLVSDPASPCFVLVLHCSHRRCSALLAPGTSNPAAATAQRSLRPALLAFCAAHEPRLANCSSSEDHQPALQGTIDLVSPRTSAHRNTSRAVFPHLSQTLLTTASPTTIMPCLATNHPLCTVVVASTRLVAPFPWPYQSAYCGLSSLSFSRRAHNVQRRQSPPAYSPTSTRLQTHIIVRAEASLIVHDHWSRLDARFFTQRSRGARRTRPRRG